jgi:hypothetical protein
MKLVDPVVRQNAQIRTVAPRLTSLDGKRIGLWSNGKLNSLELLRGIEDQLRTRHRIGDTVSGTFHVGQTMRPEEWDRLVETCDVVILANGD